MGDPASPRPRPRCYRTELNQGHRGLTKSSLAPPISETIKWKAPTFMFRGNIASFYPRSTKHVSLMFHTGAVLPDPTGLLEGDGEISRVARFRDEPDLAAKTEALRGLIGAWIELKS
jgi:hypothetical protein